MCPCSGCCPHSLGSTWRPWYSISRLSDCSIVKQHQTTKPPNKLIPSLPFPSIQKSSLYSVLCTDYLIRGFITGTQGIPDSVPAATTVDISLAPPNCPPNQLGTYKLGHPPPLAHTLSLLPQLVASPPPQSLVKVAWLTATFPKRLHFFLKLTTWRRFKEAHFSSSLIWFSIAVLSNYLLKPLTEQLQRQFPQSTTSRLPAPFYSFLPFSSSPAKTTSSLQSICSPSSRSHFRR